MKNWGTIFFLIIFIALPVHAQQDVTISEVVIEGNQRVEKATVESFVGIKPGDTVNIREINKALSKLFKTGLFADVKINIDGSRLWVKVVENPIVAEVAFEGNKRIDDEDLRAEVKLGPRAIYSKSDLQHDVKRIQTLYQRSGRFSATVIPKVIQLDQNRVNVVFEVDEGARSRIERISFVGNDSFSDSKLRSEIKTKETVWWRFFSSDDTYDPDRLAFDKELLRRYYVAHGYADFRVLSANAELSPDKEAFYVTFTVDEGAVYRFGEMSVENQLTKEKDSVLEKLIESRPGKKFNAKKVEATVDAITKHLGNQGYAFVKIDPQFKRDAENHVIGVNYLVKQGPRVYVERIDINGNVRTLDQVIRREFRLAEGDPYNTNQLKRSKERINNLGFFSRVDVQQSEGSAPDKVNIDVDVEEQSTGELTFGAGFSTNDGVLGDISLTERNLLGKGQFLRLNLSVSSVRQDIALSFTEPYFMGKNFAAGFDIFKTKYDGGSSLSNRSFDQESVGGTLRGSYPLTEHLTHALRYSYRTDDITDIDPTASLFIQRQAGENTTSLVGHSLIWDKRDSRFSPTEGWILRFNQDFAGVGGDAKFYRHEIRGAYYLSLISSDWVLKFGANAGHIDGWDDEEVRINDRFFVGGHDLRGFDNDGIGPRDKLTGDPLGGNIYATGTVELSFPLGLPEELGFSGAIFSDIGTLLEVDEMSTLANPILDESAPRVSVGIGIAWRSPFGPVRIDFSEAIVKETFDETETVRFSFGTRF